MVREDVPNKFTCFVLGPDLRRQFHPVLVEAKVVVVEDSVVLGAVRAPDAVVVDFPLWWSRVRPNGLFGSSWSWVAVEA